MEDCIRKEVSDLIEKCLQHEREKRPDLMQLKVELERIYEQFIHEGNLKYWFHHLCLFHTILIKDIRLYSFLRRQRLSRCKLSVSYKCRHSPDEGRG